MSEELKPCPFCGDTDVYLDDNGTMEWRVLKCGECGASSEARKIWRYTEDEQYDILGEVWNKRPIEDELRAEIEQLKSEVERLTSMFDMDSDWQFKQVCE